MTSGYQDFWPEDYVMPPMLLPTTAQQILAGWAMKPLDFDPGTKWQYGLGVSVGTAAGRRQISHTGEVSGFTARNDVYPDDRTAVIVLTNLDATGASSQIVNRITTMLFRATDAETERALAQAKAIFEGLQHGRIDRSLLTANTSAYFTELALADFAASLGSLGAPQEFEQTGQSLRGGMTARQFRIKFAQKTLRLTTFTMPDGKLEQYQIAAAE